MDELHKFLKKYKNERQKGSDDISIIEFNNISLDAVLPNGNLFNLEPNTVKKIDNDIKSHFKIQSNDSFYRNGIISNMYFKNDITLEECDFNLISEFSKISCNRDWLLSFCIFSRYTVNFSESDSKLDFNKSKEVKILITGSGNGGFITGMFYYFNSSSAMKQFNINWLCLDNNKKSIKFEEISRKYNFTDNIIHGFTNDSLIDHKNLMFIETMIENKYNNVNFIFNNIKPRMKSNKNKILLALAFISITSLSKNGIMITKILEPEYWSTEFNNYLILLSLLFHKTEVFRFPLCKKNKSYYSYYLAGSFRKPLLYNTVICRKIIYLLNHDEIEQAILLDDIITNTEIDEWKEKILDIQKKYNVITNPNEEIHKIINSYCKNIN